MAQYKWYLASGTVGGGDNDLDMVPNPGAYTDLVSGDKCFVHMNDHLTIYEYSTTESGAADGNRLVIPSDNASGTGAWLIKQIVPANANGWVESRTPDTTYTFTDGTRTFEITPATTSVYLIGGAVYELSAADSVVITDVEGVHWIYFDTDGDLKSYAPGTDYTETLIYDKCLVACIYWDATNSEGILIGDERHGISMSPATHYHFHEIFGSLFEEGLSFTGFDIDGSGNNATAAQFDLVAGEFHDEDKHHEIAADTDITIPTFYKSGVGGAWRRLDATATFPVADGTVGTTLDWNDYNGGDWQLQSVTSGDFVCTHYFATNDPDTPIIGIMGESTYSNLNQARTGAETEILDIQYNGLPLVEWIILGTVIWETNSTYTNQVAARARSTAEGGDYIDWRQTRQLSSIGGGTTDHEALDNLLGGNVSGHYHLTAASEAIVETYHFAGSGTPEGSVTAPVGAIYHRSDGGAGTSFYVKESGTGNTGWVAK